MSMLYNCITVLLTYNLYKIALMNDSYHFMLDLVGGFSIFVMLYCGGRFFRSLYSNCDADTAAARLPDDAFEGQVVWVTGASSGIGREFARLLVKQRAKVILSSRRKNVLEEVAKELTELSEDAEVAVVPLDLEDLDSLEEKAKEALGSFGRVDVLINNGGVSQRATAKESPFALDYKVTKVDYLSYVLLAKAVLPQMRERKAGKIINISSMAAKVGIALRTSYCGAKSAIIGWFDALRVEEYAFESGVTVCNVCPASVKTNVAINSLTEGPEIKFGRTDRNIEKGLPVEWTCERILAASHSNVDEVWIGRPWELIGAYFAQYFPSATKSLVKMLGEKVIARTLAEPESDDEEKKKNN